MVPVIQGIIDDINKPVPADTASASGAPGSIVKPATAGNSASGSAGGSTGSIDGGVCKESI